MENSPSTTKHEADDETGYRPIAPEANQLHGKKLPPEHIGQVLVSADIHPKISGKDKQPNHNAATMSRSELLDMSEEISVDNTTLRRIYDTHLIGENGLRRLVYEHTHGGDLKEALHHEILEHQTDFERDPQLRHQLAMRDHPAKSESINLKDLLKKAGIVETEGDSREAASAKKHGYQNHLETQLKQQAYQRRLLDFAFVGIILILLILVVLLALKRG